MHFHAGNYTTAGNNLGESCSFARISLAVKHTSSSIKISDEQTLIANIIDVNESSIITPVGNLPLLAL